MAVSRHTTNHSNKKNNHHSKKEHKVSKKSSKKGSSKTRKNRVKCFSPMPKDFACCLRCRKQTKMNDIKTKTTKNGRKQLIGMGACGHTVYRFA